MAERYATIMSKSSEENSDFAQRIVALEDAGKKISGIKPGTLGTYRRGQSLPGAEAIMAIVESTGCDPLWLLTGRGEPFPVADTSRPTTEAVEGAHTALIQTIKDATLSALALWPLMSQAQRRSLWWTLELASTAAKAGRWPDGSDHTDPPTPPPPRLGRRKK